MTGPDDIIVATDTDAPAPAPPVPKRRRKRGEDDVDAPPDVVVRTCRGATWGPFLVSPVRPKGVHTGWGAICRQHNNLCDSGGVVCKINRRGTSEEMRKQILEWLLAGRSVTDDATILNKREASCV